jgi:hypothetical protein
VAVPHQLRFQSSHGLRLEAARLQQIEGLPDPSFGVSTWYALPYNGDGYVSTTAYRRTSVLGFGSHVLPPLARTRSKDAPGCSSVMVITEGGLQPLSW